MDAPTPVDGTSAAKADGRIVGRRYTLRSSVGSGGMGTVWRAFDELLRREVAVKEVLLPPGIPAPERSVLCERTLREARAAAALNHPSVIRVYDVVNDGDRPWIVMELLDAASLADTLRDEGPLPYDRVAEIGLAVLGALEAAHRMGVLHRDVKPGNVLLGTDGRVTLTDFGVARSPNESPLTSTGLLLGSPQYIAPERARGRPFGPPSDLFSLGATLYTAVEGRPPFDRGDPLPTMTAVVVEPPDQMAFAGPMMPVLLGLLEKDPQQRWDAEKTRTALRTVLGGGRITSLDSRAPRQTRAPGRGQRREEPGANPVDRPSSTTPMPTTPAAPASTPPPPAGGAQNRSVPPAPPGMPSSGGPAENAKADIDAATPSQRPAAEGTAAMPVSPFTTEGLPSVPADEPGSGAAEKHADGASHQPGTSGMPGGGQARGGRYAGSASVRGGAPASNGQQFSGHARVPGPTYGAAGQQQAGYEPNFGEPGNATAPLPSAPPPTAPRRSAYLDGNPSNIGGHTMVAPQPQVSNWYGRRKTVLVIIAAVVAVVLIGVLSYVVSIATSDDGDASAKRTTAPSATAATNLTFYDFSTDRGFSVSAPKGWKESKASSYVDFDQGESKIRALVEEARSPEKALEAAERQQKGRDDLEDFHTIRMEESPSHKLSGKETWEWEWTYTQDDVPRHRLWRVAVVDGKSYQLYLSTTEDQYDEQVKLFDQVSDTYKLNSA